MPIKTPTTNTKVKTTTKINLAIGMFAALFLAAGFVSEAFIKWTPLYSGTANQKDNISPTVKLISPNNGETVWGFITIKAQASDNIGVAQAKFYVSNQLQYIDTDASDGWSLRWNTDTALNGDYDLLVTVNDRAGNFSSSSVTTITINN